MIFKQVQEIIDRRKTQTRRVCKANEQLYHDSWTSETAVVQVLPMPMPPKYKPRYRTKWLVGNTYAVQPGRGKPIAMYSPATGNFAHELSPVLVPEENVQNGYRALHGTNWQDAMKRDGWQPLRIRITNIHQLALWEITEADAIAEGVAPVHVSRSALIGPGMSNIQQAQSNLSFVAAYRVLWDSINTKPGTRWQDNPMVWVLEFEAVTHETV